MYRPAEAAMSPPATSPPPSMDLPLLLSRLREYVTVNRIRGSEFFQDFDPLRSGSIAASRFRQVSQVSCRIHNKTKTLLQCYVCFVHVMYIPFSKVQRSVENDVFFQGLSSLGQPSLTDEEFTALSCHYADPRHKGNVLWKAFISDIDQGICLCSLYAL